MKLREVLLLVLLYAGPDLGGCQGGKCPGPPNEGDPPSSEKKTIQ